MKNIHKSASHAIIDITQYHVAIRKVNTFAPLQVKNKPCDGETEHAFILDSILHGCEL